MSQSNDKKNDELKRPAKQLPETGEAEDGKRLDAGSKSESVAVQNSTKNSDSSSATISGDSGNTGASGDQTWPSQSASPLSNDESGEYVDLYPTFIMEHHHLYDKIQLTDGEYLSDIMHIITGKETENWRNWTVYHSDASTVQVNGDTLQEMRHYNKIPTTDTSLIERGHCLVIVKVAKEVDKAYTDGGPPPPTSGAEAVEQSVASGPAVKQPDSAPAVEQSVASGPAVKQPDSAPKSLFPSQVQKNTYEEFVTYPVGEKSLDQVPGLNIEYSWRIYKTYGFQKAKQLLVEYYQQVKNKKDFKEYLKKACKPQPPHLNERHLDLCIRALKEYCENHPKEFLTDAAEKKDPAK